MTKPATVTITLDLTYDAWRDVEGALLDRAAQANAHSPTRHTHMADRLNEVRHAIEAQVREQKPRWR